MSFPISCSGSGYSKSTFYFHIHLKDLHFFSLPDCNKVLACSSSRLGSDSIELIKYCKLLRIAFKILHTRTSIELVDLKKNTIIHDFIIHMSFVVSQ
jgi:hypothetical protein